MTRSTSAGRRPRPSTRGLAALLLLIAPTTSAAQQAPTTTTADAARAALRTWRRTHLSQEAARLDASMSELALLKRKAAKEGRRDPALEARLKQARARQRAARGAAAQAFVKAGRALEAALVQDPAADDLHAGRAELFTTLAGSGRSIGAVLGDSPPGLLSYGMFERGLASARRAFAARPAANDRRYYLARMATVFNRFEEAQALIAPISSGDAALPRDRLFDATLCFYRNAFAAGDAQLDTLIGEATTRRRATELRAITRHAAGLWSLEQLERAKETERGDLPRVELRFSTGLVTLELFEDSAPNTVANFLGLVESGFYEGQRVHRSLSNFLVQLGDPTSRERDSKPGKGGPGWRIPLELSARVRAHFRGSLAMSRRGPHSAGSQFYMGLVPLPYLDGEQVVFGAVIEGLELVDALRAGDQLLRARVLRKRPHAYPIKKIKP